MAYYSLQDKNLDGLIHWFAEGLRTGQLNLKTGREAVDKRLADLGVDFSTFMSKYGETYAFNGVPLEIVNPETGELTGAAPEPTKDYSTTEPPKYSTGDTGTNIPSYDRYVSGENNTMEYVPDATADSSDEWGYDIQGTKLEDPYHSVLSGINMGRSKYGLPPLDTMPNLKENPQEFLFAIPWWSPESGVPIEEAVMLREGVKKGAEKYGIDEQNVWNNFLKGPNDPNFIDLNKLVEKKPINDAWKAAMAAATIYVGGAGIGLWGAGATAGEVAAAASTGAKATDALTGAAETTDVVPNAVDASIDGLGDYFNTVNAPEGLSAITNAATPADAIAAARSIGGLSQADAANLPTWIKTALTGAGLIHDLTTNPPTTDPNVFNDALNNQQTANADTIANQTFSNRMNQVGPGGSIDYSVNQIIDPTTGQPRNQWTQTTTLSPEQQALLEGSQSNQFGQQNLQRQSIGNAKGALKDPVSMEGLPEAGVVPGLSPVTGTDKGFGAAPTAGTYGAGTTQSNLDFSGAPTVTDPGIMRSRVEDSIYNKAASRLDPRFQQAQNDTEIKLRQQGLRPGDEAYDRAMGNLGRERTDAYGQASMDSIMGGGVEQQRQFDQELGLRKQDIGETTTMGNFFNTAEGQRFMQELSAGGQGFSEALQSAGFMDSQRNQDLAQQLSLGQYNYGQGTQQFGMQNQARQQAISDMLLPRNQALAELGSLQTGAQPMTVDSPSFALQGAQQPVDYLGAATNFANTDLANQNAQRAQQDSIMNGIYNLLGQRYE